MTTQVSIVGAGLSGILLAHYLLSRGDRYRVNLFDRRSDPRTVSFSNYRTYPLSLVERGFRALRAIPGLEEAVIERGVKIEQTVFHQKNGKTVVFRRTKPILTIDRTSLAIALLDRLTQLHDRDRLQIHFNCECTGVDLQSKTAKFSQQLENSSEELCFDYDLLVGADGARSVVRNALLQTERFEFQQKYLDNDYKTLFLPPLDAESAIDLSPGSIHSWRLDDGTAFLAVPQPDRSVSCVITFPRQNPTVVNLKTPREVKDFFSDKFPAIGQLIPDTEAEDFIERPTSTLITVRCNRYHQGDSLLLIGDAAHAVSPSLGQGGNAALEDAMLFNNLLDRYNDNLGVVLSEFSRCRLPDAHALLELSDRAFPLSKSLFIELMLRRQVGKILHRYFPQVFSPFLFDLVSETTMPYGEILQAYRGWLDKVQRSNEKFLARLSAQNQP